jgi:hypothetical protein
MTLIVSAFLASCFASKPHHNVGFTHVQSIRDLAGSYENRGEGADVDVPWYLSTVIWPDSLRTTLGAPGINHRAIVTIEVAALGDTALHVRALRNDGLEKEQTFVAGKDFQFHSGRLIILHRTESTMKPESPMLGVMHTSLELGLDEKGEGKYQKTEEVAGLVYLVVPMAFRQSSELRFRRKAGPRE